jgi:uncharacterized membrane protein
VELAASLLKLSHIASGMLMVASLLGSRLLNVRAERSEDIEQVRRLTRAAGPFDRVQTVSGPVLLLTGFATAWAQGLPLIGLSAGWVLASVGLFVSLVILVVTVYRPAGARMEAAIQAAQAEARVTDDLRRVRARTGAERLAFWYGEAVTPAIIALMVLKPF